MIARVGLVAALLSVSLTGCGGDDSAGAQSTSGGGPAETWPSCDDVWVTGKTLDKDYEGCVIQGNDIKVYSPEQCNSGTEYASYEDRWYAVPGDTIHESKSGDIYSDKAFQKFTASC